MEPLLTVNHLSVRLKKKGTSLVNDVSFQANSGQILGIIGESGSGKSMTCRALMGFWTPVVFSSVAKLFSKVRIYSSYHRKNCGRCVEIISL